MILQRIHYWHAQLAGLYHEWALSPLTAQARARQLVEAGVTTVPDFDIVDVDVPFDDIANLVHFLNETYNNPIQIGVKTTMSAKEYLDKLPPAPAGTQAAATTPFPEITADSVGWVTSQGARQLKPLGEWLTEQQDATSETIVRAKASALDSQVGGDHYKKLGDFQPWEVLKRWLTKEEFHGYMKGTAIAYLARELDKGGNQDIEKATHTLQGLLEMEGREKT